jgi:hypothetical protein
MEWVAVFEGDKSLGALKTNNLGWLPANFGCETLITTTPQMPHTYEKSTSMAICVLTFSAFKIVCVVTLLYFHSSYRFVFQLRSQ